MGYLQNGGDLKMWMTNRSDNWKYRGYLGSVDYKFSALIPEAALEVGVKVFPWFGLCLSAGYLPKKWIATLDVTAPWDTPGNTIKLTESVQARFLPLSLSGLFSLPLSFLDINFQGGVAYYLAQFDYSLTGNVLNPNNAGKLNYRWAYAESFETTNISRFGYHLGLGLEFKLSSHMGLVVETRYRKVKFTDIKGSRHYKSNEIWAGGSSSREESEPDVTWELESSLAPWGGRTYHCEFVKHIEPPARPFVINLDGLFLTAGVKIRL